MPTVEERLNSSGERGPEQPGSAGSAEVFRRVFRQLKPSTDPPGFDIRFRPYAKLRSTIHFDADSCRIRANLSDLVESAPADVLEALATILLSKLYRKRVPKRVNQHYNRWTHSPETQQRMLEIRKARGSKQVLPPAGAVHDLDVLFERLNERHFGATLRKPELGWSPRASRRRLGHYDQAHDVIVISRVFDRAEVPALALEYVLFHEMLHLKHPVQLRGAKRCVHTPEFVAEERQFPGIDDAERMLRYL